MKSKTFSKLFTASALAAALMLIWLSSCTDLSVNPPQNMTITYNLKVENGSGGSVSPTTQNNIVAGIPVNVKATPNSGYVFSHWSLTSGLAIFADQYSTSTSVVLGWNATIKANFLITYGTFTDSRNNKTYKIVTIDGKRWMAENLNYAMSSGSWCYGNDPANCDKYGRLYDWSTARTACPSGWHLPSNQEWYNLVTTAGGSSVAGSKLKSASGWNSNGNGTDEFGFSALPGGYRYSGTIFDDAGSIGHWWSATESFFSGLFACSRGMGYNIDYVNEYFSSKELGYSVRCVED